MGPSFKAYDILKYILLQRERGREGRKRGEEMREGEEERRRGEERRGEEMGEEGRGQLIEMEMEQAN